MGYRQYCKQRPKGLLGFGVSQIRNENPYPILKAISKEQNTISIKTRKKILWFYWKLMEILHKKKDSKDYEDKFNAYNILNDYLDI